MGVSAGLKSALLASLGASAILFHGAPALAGTVGEAQAAASASKPPTRSRPNIIFIAIDDLNDWVSPLGANPQSQTPNIARLAASGTLFVNAHTQAPICGPSRASLLTGMRPSTTGFYGQKPALRAAPSTRSATSIFQHFAKNGYHTLGAGKVFHYLSTEAQKAEFETVGPNLDIVPRPKKIVRSEGLSSYSEIDWGVDDAAGSAASDQAIAAWAAEQIRSFSTKAEGRPFFMALGFYLPHIPIYAPQRYFDQVPDEANVQLPSARDDDLDDVPAIARQLHQWKPNLPGLSPVEPDLAWLKRHDQWRSLVRAYLAGVRVSDEQVGVVLTALQQSRLAENTIVVLWSDHGWHLGEKGLVGKSTLWERSTRVPIIFAGPGVAAGGVVRSPAELLDLYPTLADLAGLDRPPALEGLSLRPQLRNADAPRRQPAITSYHYGNFAVRDARWRYIRYVDGSEELYDHRVDPDEVRNLACERRFSSVKTRLAAFLPAQPASPVPGSDDPTVMRRGDEFSFAGKPAVWSPRRCPA
ncbi:MAG: sulfatase [Phenylobacterium sp.]|uniref:sulfatase n=1 Tax=Phenylobacterium sp. TaxID=1871053 RepID=UPI001A38D8CB|nr:sulfatase [Phenylobacterium sp.]MBL8772426.1 sulfatase [Phenylobacterium sp.]